MSSHWLDFFVLLARAWIGQRIMRRLGEAALPPSCGSGLGVGWLSCGLCAVAGLAAGAAGEPAKPDISSFLFCFFLPALIFLFVLANLLSGQYVQCVRSARSMCQVSMSNVSGQRVQCVRSNYSFTSKSN